jgi:hypothetical protein
VVRAVGAEHLVTSGGEARHANGVLVGIRPSVGEEDLAEVASGDTEDALGRLATGEVAVGGGDGRQKSGLVLDCLHQSGVAVPDIDVHQLAREVEVLRAVEVPDSRAETAGDDKGREGSLGAPRVEDVCPVEVVGELSV